MTGVLPNFLLIGAEKAGTTSVHNHLRAHPEVFMSRVKEPLFFAFEGQTLAFRGPTGGINRRAVTTLDRYQALFEGAERYRAIGESSATYLYHDRSPERAAHYVPNAKLIVILRNPADRAYSNFMQAVRIGAEPLDFGAALEAEPERIAAQWSPFFYYKSKGWYDEQLSRWMTHFPPEQFLFLLYDDLRANPLDVMRRIYEFIGVNPDFRPDVEVHYNLSGKPLSPGLHQFIKGNSPIHSLSRMIMPAKLRARLKTDIMRWNLARPSMPPQSRARLLADYAPDIAKLGPRIGRDLSAWVESVREGATEAEGILAAPSAVAIRYQGILNRRRSSVRNF